MYYDICNIILYYTARRADAQKRNRYSTEQNQAENTIQGLSCEQWNLNTQGIYEQVQLIKL